MVCAGSLNFNEEQTESDAAKEGTAAGEWLERLLTGQSLPTHARNGVMFDEDMKFYTGLIAEKIMKRSLGPILCEQEVTIHFKSGIKIKGHYDACYEDSTGEVLYVDDLKYGWVIVDVFENWQLLSYAIGEVIRRQKAYKKIVLTIHQPRPHHEDGDMRQWELSYEELLSYKDRIEERMDQIAAGLNTLVTSKNCKYCPAAAEACTALNRALFSAVDYTLNYRVPDKVSDKELEFQLNLLDRVKEIIKIKDDSLKNLAIERIKNGKVIPGYTTEISYGHRTWNDGISPKVVESMFGRKVTEEVMLSAAKVEKLGIPKKILEQFTNRPSSGMKLKRGDASKKANDIFGNNAPVKLT